MSEGHALLNPSGAEGWSNCAAKVSMEDGEPNDGSEYADEGTAAHWVGTECLDHKKEAHEFIGQTIRVVNGKVPSGKKGRVSSADVVREFEVDEDFAANVQIYVDTVRDYVGNGGQLMTEQRLPISQITGEKGARGTSDAVVFRDGDELIVIDLKFGRGEVVDAVKNKQGIMYIIAAFDEYNGLCGDFKRFRFVISQPRVRAAPSEWDFSLTELEQFRKELMAKAETALGIYEKRNDWLTFDKTGKYSGAMKLGELELFKVTPKGCRWCRGKHKCPALEKFVADTVGADFPDLAAADDNELNPTQENPIPPPAALSSDWLAVKLKSVHLLQEFCSSVMAEADRRILSGIPVPGYKAVMGKKGNRKWDDETEVDDLLAGARIKIEERYTFKLKSPTQLEKMLKDRPRLWPKLQKKITQADGRPSVAPDHDPRPALVIAPTADDFPDVPEEADDIAS